MSIIKDITIENIKGYGTPPVTLPVELKTNRVNIIFAPNGTGKSSLAAAFRSLTNKNLEVAKEVKYHKDEILLSSLSLSLDGTQYSADITSNLISPAVQPYIINCATVVHTTQHNMGRFTSVSGYIDIEDIVIEKSIPYCDTKYSVTAIKRLFGVNGKVLQNLSAEFNSPRFLLCIRGVWGYLDTFHNAKYRINLVDEVLLQINALRGNAQQIINQIDADWLHEIESNEYYIAITNVLSSCFPAVDKKGLFLYFYQLTKLWLLNKVNIKAATAYVEYQERRKKFDSNLQLLDTTWRNIHTEEDKGNLVVKFPHADEISNGQRDLLTFIVEVIKFKLKIRSDKKYLLLIDEIFDYLDDANLIAAQFYLTSFLDISRDNLFLCILSHLNPYSFRSYVFSDKKINVQYLKQTVPTASKEMMAFIAFRESLDRSIPGPSEILYRNLSRNLFHYSPDKVDYSNDILALKSDIHLHEEWGKTEILHQILVDEVNKYFNGSNQYDPYAVAMALRIKVEKIMYEKLSEPLKTGFVDEKMTKNKFNYCHNNGVEVPDILYIVSAIHNEADHVKLDAVSHRYIEKPMVYKLQNNVIKGILVRLFGWSGINLSKNILD